MDLTVLVTNFSEMMFWRETPPWQAVSLVNPHLGFVWHLGSHVGPHRNGFISLKPKIYVAELGRLVTTAYTSKDHNTCLALEQVVMLPQDVADLDVEDSTEFGNLMVMQHVQNEEILLQSQEGQHESDLKEAKDAIAMSKLEADVAQEKLHKALHDLDELYKVYERVFNHGYNRAGDFYERQVAKLHPNIFQEGWLAYLKELGTPAEHPGWIVAALEPELMHLPKGYSPLILPGFKEEEYMNQLIEEGNEGLAEVDVANKGNELRAREGEEGIGEVEIRTFP
ncbi:hypothetical protein Acr_00g0077960 [Actinidia rufa]|uniref:Uncharacterized protein n=1 Tax=Actinidia rufa TaxID=165716 RepID=A0A7J0DTS7_9ERIC|nr:hypothetical protein Acr_00g0077960 [Actinidia rufa]